MQIGNYNFKKYELDIKDFTQGSFIGTGTFGHVFNVKQNGSDVPLVAKIIYRSKDQEDYEKLTRREVENMIRCQHPNIVKFIGYSLTDFNGDNNTTIIMKKEIYNLAELLKDARLPKPKIIINNTIRQKILIGIASGLKYLHKQKIVHRDIKPSNILLDENFNPMITDFGFSKFISMKNNDSMRSEFHGKMNYSSPEILNYDDDVKYSTKTDVFSYAIIMYEIVTNLPPYKRNYKPVNHPIMLGERPIFDPQKPINPKLKGLIEQCWSDNPDDRPSFEDIFNMLAYGICSFKDENDIYDCYLEGADIGECIEYANSISGSNLTIFGVNEAIDTKINHNQEKLLKTINNYEEKLHVINQINSQIESKVNDINELLHKNNKNNDELIDDQSIELLMQKIKKVKEDIQSQIDQNKYYLEEQIKKAEDQLNYQIISNISQISQQKKQFHENPELINHNQNELEFKLHDQLEIQINKNNEELQKQINQNKGQFEDQIKKINEQLQNCINHDKSKTLEEQINKNNEELQKQIDHIKKDLQNQIQINEKQNSEKLIDKDQHKELQKQIDQNKKQFEEQIKQINKQLQNCINQNKNKTLEEQINKSNEKLQKQINQNKGQFEDQIKQINEQLQNCINHDKSKTFEKQINKNNEELSKQINQNKRQFEEQINISNEKLSKQINQNKRQFEEQIRQINEQLQNHINQDKCKTLEEQINKNNEELQKQIDHIKKDLQNQIQINEKQKSRIDELEKAKNALQSENKNLKLQINKKTTLNDKNEAATQKNVKNIVPKPHKSEENSVNKPKTNSSACSEKIQNASNAASKNNFYVNDFNNQSLEKQIEFINKFSPDTCSNTFIKHLFNLLIYIRDSLETINSSEKYFEIASNDPNQLFNVNTDQLPIKILQPAIHQLYLQNTNEFKQKINNFNEIIIVLTYFTDDFLKEFSFISNILKTNKNMKTSININKKGMSATGTFFKENDLIHYVTVGNDVDCIKGDEFKGYFFKCSLTSIVIPQSISIIGKKAFYECKSLQIVEFKTLSDKDNKKPILHTISNQSFYGCENLRQIEFPSTLTKISEEAFKGCILLSKVVFQNSLETIANGAFYDCKALKEVIIPKSVKTEDPTLSNAFSTTTKVVRL